MHLITPDLFLFLDQSPGNDGDISEKKRILAQVDLPRPEVLLNVWSMQLSTTEPNDVSRFNTNLKRVVSDYNNGLQEAINQSFFYLTEQMTDRPYFAPDFYRYLVGR